MRNYVSIAGDDKGQGVWYSSIVETSDVNANITGKIVKLPVKL